MNERIALAKRLVRIARELSAANGPFDNEKYDELRKKSEDELVASLTKYAQNVQLYADTIRKKNIGYVIDLQNQISELEKQLNDGKIKLDDYNKQMKKLDQALERKNAYANGQFPEALDVKNYSDAEYKFVDSVMRQGGSIRETLAALAFIKTENEKIANLATGFCEYLNGLLANNGFKLRAILSKQSGNRDPYHAMLQSVPNRTRMKQACDNAENCTREICADMVDAKGKVIAHISFLNQMQQRVADKGKELDQLKFETNVGVMASAKTAGLFDTLKNWTKSAVDYFKGMLNSFTKFCKECFDSFKKLFTSTDKYKNLVEKDYLEIATEFEAVKKMLK